MHEKVKRDSTYADMAAVISKPYLTYRDVMVLVPINCKYAREAVREIQEVMKEKGEPIIAGRPLLVPTDYVLKKYGLKRNEIFKKAKAMKGANS